MIQIQATVSGFGGGATTLFSAYDPAARLLVIAKDAGYREERRPGCVVLTNIDGIPRDSMFDVSEFRGAVEAYYALKQGVSKTGGPRLVFDSGVSRTNPDSAVERDGVDERGPKYRIADTITCAQVAVLATCEYAMRAEAIDATVNMARRFERIAMGEILTF